MYDVIKLKHLLGLWISFAERFVFWNARLILFEIDSQGWYVSIITRSLTRVVKKLLETSHPAPIRNLEKLSYLN